MILHPTTTDVNAVTAMMAATAGRSRDSSSQAMGTSVGTRPAATAAATAASAETEVMVAGVQEEMGVIQDRWLVKTQPSRDGITAGDGERESTWS